MLFLFASYDPIFRAVDCFTCVFYLIRERGDLNFGETYLLHEILLYEVDMIRIRHRSLQSVATPEPQPNHAARPDSCCRHSAHHSAHT
jgi:hypothetical protein